MQYRVHIADRASRQLRKAPKHVVTKLNYWSRAVERDGMPEVRKIPGFHDEPLRGLRAGQRSIRLNKQWRAIYKETASGSVALVEIQEVTPHDY